MLLKNRPFVREAPTREAKSIFIFCEGVKRERDYFNYFKEIDSRINIEVYDLHAHDNNSPLGLLEIAENAILVHNDDSPKYSFDEGDEVWIIFDSDPDKYQSRKPQIEEILRKCQKREGWFVAQSNPCFEVWLYYHFLEHKPEFEGMERCSGWKKLVDEIAKGGFDSRKHPLLIETACRNAQTNFTLESEAPEVGSTEVYKLGKNIFSLLKIKIENAIQSSISANSFKK